jgi:glycosyltransferase involved in cell wall biosynthesis
MPELSVIVPVYNEEATIASIIERVSAVPVDKEIIVVDDGSTDATARILRGLQVPGLKVIHHSSNRGKGAAVATAIFHAQADYAVIQDADLEYDPQDCLKLLAEVKEGRADLALGARFTKGYRGLLVHRAGNRFLTWLVNTLFGTRLNDCFTCYKLCRREVLRNLGLKARSFDIEIEIIARAVRRGLRVRELPIAYHPRSYAQGKKIRLLDGLWAAGSIIRYRLMR